MERGWEWGGTGCVGGGSRRDQGELVGGRMMQETESEGLEAEFLQEGNCSRIDERQTNYSPCCYGWQQQQRRQLAVEGEKERNGGNEAADASKMLDLTRCRRERCGRGWNGRLGNGSTSSVSGGHSSTAKSKSDATRQGWKKRGGERDRVTKARRGEQRGGWTGWRSENWKDGRPPDGDRQSNKFQQSPGFQVPGLSLSLSRNKGVRGRGE